MALSTENSIAFLINKALVRLKRQLLANIKDYDITTEQWSVLARLWAEDGISQTCISHRTNKDLPTITRIVNKLDKKGLIQKKSDPTDSRTTLVFLTEKGKNLQNYIDPISNLIETKLLEGLKTDEIEELKRLLKIIILNLEK